MVWKRESATSTGAAAAAAVSSGEREEGGGEVAEDGSHPAKKRPRLEQHVWRAPEGGRGRGRGRGVGGGSDGREEQMAR